MSNIQSDSKITEAPNNSYTLIYSAFIAGLCSIVYELLIATSVSYFLGDSVRHFSITIGLYMAAMGAGSYFSKYFETQLIFRFVIAETLLGLLGGLSIPLLYLSYSFEGFFYPTYILLTISIGFLIGLEIPFLTRLMESYQILKTNIANILSFDYVGALIATLAFPFLLLPFLGTYKSSVVLGLVNLSIVFVVLRKFKQELISKNSIVKPFLVITGLILGTVFIFSEQFLQKWDQSLYVDRIVHSEQTLYQKVVLTKNKNDVRLYLNGNIQFSSVDEYRYHEALVVFPMSYITHKIDRVLLLGAGDGLATRELLKYPEIQEITIVELDERITELATSNPHINELNHGSLEHPKVHVKHQDAFIYLKENTQPFDLIISDLPDPNSISLSRLYSKQFYRLLKTNLTTNGTFVTQATSPYFARKAFWSISNTVSAAGFETVVPYHLNVPSFGEWGFVLAGTNIQTEHSVRPLPETKFINRELLTSMQLFSKDISPLNVEVNGLDRPVLMNYYLEGWRTFN